MVFFTLADSDFSAFRKSYVICRFIQNSADVLKNVPNRNAVSPVIPRSPFRIAVIRLGGTSMALAKALAVRPSGFKNSSFRISPGGTGRIPFFLMFIPFLMIVRYFHIVWPIILPYKTNTPPVVNPNAVLPCSIP